MSMDRSISGIVLGGQLPLTRKFYLYKISGRKHMGYTPQKIGQMASFPLAGISGGPEHQIIL